MSRQPLGIPNMTGRVVDSGRVQLLNRIGHGGWGVVYRARDLSETPSAYRAVKVISKPTPKSKRYMFLGREIDSHYRVTESPHIVTIHRAFEDDKYLYILLDYCPGGDMWRAIMDRAAFARNSGLLKLAFLQMIDAVQACHDKGIYHRDIKPNNILVSANCTKVYLTDFGLSTQTKQSFSHGVGTRQYKSPEACGSRGVHKSYNTARSDIWALGVSLVNMITGKMPWKEATNRDAAYAAHLRNPNFLRQTLPISKEANFILQRIFCPEQEDCISLERLRQLVQSVQTFWMTEEEIARAGPMFRSVAKAYIYEDSDLSSEGERFSSAQSGDSLDDDSDDSDEHSQGVRSQSLLAIEEGVRGVPAASAATTKLGDAHVEPRLSTPEAPVVSPATPPKPLVGILQASSYLAPPDMPMPAFLPSSSADERISLNTQTATSSTCVSIGVQQQQDGRKDSGMKSRMRMPKSLQRLFGMNSR